MSDIEMESINGEEDEISTRDVKQVLASSDEEGEIRDSDGEDDKEIRWQSKKKDWSREESAMLGKINPMEEQAKKFVIEDSEALYTSLGIGEENEERRHARLDTIHMYGTQNMCTNDVFKYFHAHKPLYLEWVNPSSCNIVWPDDISAAEALVFYSEEGETYDQPAGKWRIGVKDPKADKILLRFATKCDEKVTGKDKMLVLVKKYKDITMDSEQQVGFVSKSMINQIKTTQSNVSGEEEEKTKNPWGELCQSWGINDSQEVFGAPNYKTKPVTESPTSYASRPTSVKDRIGRRPANAVLSLPRLPFAGKSNLILKARLGKRTLMDQDEDSEDSDEEWSEEEIGDSDEEWRSRSKVPRMRMHADDEQEKLDKSKTKRLLDLEDHLDIRVEIENQTATKNAAGHSRGDLRARLKEKQAEQDDISGSDEEVQSGSSTVWSRLDLPRNKSTDKRNPSTAHSKRLDDIRFALSKPSLKIPSCRPGFEKDDLRSRLGKKNNSPGSPLRIEIDNEHYIQSNL